MPVVTLIDLNSPKLKELEILAKIHEVESNISFRDIVKSKKGWAVHLLFDEERANILDSKTRKQLKDLKKLEIVKPPDYKAACTIMVMPQDDTVLYVDSVEIMEATGANIVDLEVLSCYTMKFECDTPEEASRVLKKPIKMDFCTIHPEEMAVQKYVKVPQCTRCYSYEHERLVCLEDQHCFVCGQEGHINLSCEVNPPICKNCQGDHVAIAFKCPVRKAKRDELERIAYARNHPEESSPERDDADEGAVGGTTNGPTNEDLTQEELNAISSSEVIRISREAIETFRNPGLSPLNNRTSFSTNSRDNQQRSSSEGSCSSEQSSGVSSSPAVVHDQPWRQTRFVRAPDPEKGEGPLRQCKPIPNFKPETIVTPNPDVLQCFSVLPKRQLRCLVNSIGINRAAPSIQSC